MPALTASTLTLRPQAIAAAESRGALLAEQGYTIEFCEIWPGAFTVSKPGANADEPTRYRGWLPGALAGFPEGKCECEAWKRNGLCKHVCFAVQFPDIETAHEAAHLEALEQSAAYFVACAGAGVWDVQGAPTLEVSHTITDQIDSIADFTGELIDISPDACPYCGTAYMWEGNNTCDNCGMIHPSATAGDDRTDYRDADLY